MSYRVTYRIPLDPPGQHPGGGPKTHDLYGPLTRDAATPQAAADAVLAEATAAHPGCAITVEVWPQPDMDTLAVHDEPIAVARTTPHHFTRESIRATDEADRGPVLCWESDTGRVAIILRPDIPGFPQPDTILEDLGTVRTIGGEYGPWDDDYWTAAVELAARAGWHRHPLNRHGSFAPHHGWKMSPFASSLYLATIDRSASSEAMARHAATLAAAGVAVDVPGPEADIVRRMRAHRDSLTDQDALISAGIDAGMSDRAISREMGLSPATIGRKRKALPAGAGYFEDKARAVFTRAGGDPDRAGSLAAWARTVHPTRDSRLGVVVAEDGTILAQTRRSSDGPVQATYISDVYDDADRAVVGREAGLALGHFRRRTGTRVIQVTYSDVCTGAGKSVR